MNLSPVGAQDPGGPLAPSEWRISVRLEVAGAPAYYVADLTRSGQHVCRLALMGISCTEEEARSKLAFKARLWIDDYSSRTHTGDTQFDAL